jgi:hypothetical protein
LTDAGVPNVNEQKIKTKGETLASLCCAFPHAHGHAHKKDKDLTKDKDKVIFSAHFNLVVPYSWEYSTLILMALKKLARSFIFASFFFLTSVGCRR